MELSSLLFLEVDELLVCIHDIRISLLSYIFNIQREFYIKRANKFTAPSSFGLLPSVFLGLPFVEPCNVKKKRECRTSIIIEMTMRNIEREYNVRF